MNAHVGRVRVGALIRHPVIRRVATAVAGVGGPVAILVLKPAELGCYLLTCVSVAGLGRTRMPWAQNLPARPLVRIGLRVGVYVVPLVALGRPTFAWSIPGAVVGVAVATVGLWIQRQELREAFRPEMLRLFTYPDRTEKAAELLYFGAGGAVQEYLHRGIGLSALAGLGPWSVPITTLAFVAEHLGHLRSMGQWDRKDVVWQTILGATLGTVTYATGGIASAVIGHTLFNLPNIARSALTPVEPRLR